MIVADTNLVTHLFNETDLTEVAQQILTKDPYWLLPKLWQEEYANVLSKLARAENQSVEMVLELFNYAVEELKNCEVEIDNRKALRISIENKISVYDAHFVLLAMDFDTLLITEDKEVLKRCPEFTVNMKNFLKM